VRKGPRARRTKSVDRIDRYFEMAAQEGPEQELDVELVIPPAPKLANRVIELRQVGMELGERLLFDHVNLDLAAGERMGIVGRNGLGKSTLVKIIMGELAPTFGEVEIGARTEINYVDQNRLALDEDKTIWEEVGGGLEYVRLVMRTSRCAVTCAGSSSRRSHQFKDPPAERRRAEPSDPRENPQARRQRAHPRRAHKRSGPRHLAPAREALLIFDGSVIVVSHDRYFLNRICTSILAFEGEGVVRRFVGNYDYYLEKRGALPPVVEPPSITKAAAKPAAVAEKGRKLKWKEERELEGMEATILAAENEVARLEQLLASPDFYATQRGDWAKAEAELTAARSAVARLYKRWEELEALRAG
jgi:ATP-binding cassette subfamily F protein uup